MAKTMKTMKTMKAMKAAGKAMTKGALVKLIAEKHELKTKVCNGLLVSLAALATAEAKVAKLTRRPLHTFVFISCFSAINFTRAPLVMALPAVFMAFMVFMVLAIATQTRSECKT